MREQFESTIIVGFHPVHHICKIQTQVNIASCKQSFCRTRTGGWASTKKLQKKKQKAQPNKERLSRLCGAGVPWDFRSK